MCAFIFFNPIVLLVLDTCPLFLNQLSFANDLMTIIMQPRTTYSNSQESPACLLQIPSHLVLHYWNLFLNYVWRPHGHQR